MGKLGGIVIGIGSGSADELSASNGNRKGGGKVGVAAGVGSDGLEAEKSLALAIAGGILSAIGEEFQSEGTIWRAVKGAGNGGAAAVGSSRGNYREILQVIGTGVGVAVVVGGDVAASKIDA